MRELQPGDVVAGYRIEAVVGAGGMGVVYRAVHLRLQRADALKVIAPALAEEEEFRSRFERESRLAAQIDHPNVIPIFSAGEEDGLLYISMRLVEGTDVREVLRREGRLEPRRAARIAAAVASALDAAHASGLVHRDVKPANVLLAHAPDGEHVYLTDFGLSKVISAVEGETKTGTFVGTVDYVSPEQVRGHRLDARSDVYSLGCTLFHMVTGRVPFPADFEAAKLVAHASEPVPSVLAIAPDVPARFESVIARAMAKHPEERYPSAGDLGRAALAAAERRDMPRAEASVARGAAAPREPTVVTRSAPSDRASGAPAAAAPRVEAAAGPGAPAAAGPSPPPAPQPAPEREPAATPDGRPGRSRRVLMSLTAGAAAAAAVAVAVSIASPGSKRAPRTAGSGPREAISVGSSPNAVAVGYGSVWVANSGSNTVTRIAPATGRVVGPPIAVGSSPHAMAVGPNTLWVSNDGDGTVTRIDPGTGQVLGRSIQLGNAGAIAVGLGSVWVVTSGEHVSRLDPSSGAHLGQPILVGMEPQAIAVGLGSAWVAAADGTVTRIDARSERVVWRRFIGPGARCLVVLGSTVWVVLSSANAVARINPDTGELVGQPIQVGSDPGAVAVGQGSVWVANSMDNTVTRINANTATVAGQPIRVGSNPQAIAVGQGSVWVANLGDNSVTRIDGSTGKVISAAG